MAALSDVPGNSDQKQTAGFSMEALGSEFVEKILNNKKPGSHVAQSEHQATLSMPSSIREVEKEHDREAGSSNLLNDFGRELAGNLIKTSSSSLQAPSVSLKELEQREFDEGRRSSLLDALGRDLFQHTTAAGTGVAGQSYFSRRGR